MTTGERLRREQLRRSAQRTPSDLSLASSSSLNSTASSPRVSSFNLPSLLVGEAFDHDQILRASNYLSNTNLIRHGHTGDLFYGVLDDGTRVVIKRIDLSSTKKELYRISELEVFAKASHPSLVPLLGHCLDNLNEKFLVYKYMSNRDLSTCLFGETDLDDDRVPLSLDWIKRLRIAIGAAEALSHLHHQCIPLLVLINAFHSLFTGGLNKALLRERVGCGERCKPMEGSWRGQGTSNATRAFDVYCFGKVLLELVTGKLGFSTAVANDSTVNDKMGQTLSYITVNNIELVRQIIDEDLLTKVWATAVIAKACLNCQPSKRPAMTNVDERSLHPLSKVVRQATAYCHGLCLETVTPVFAMPHGRPRTPGNTPVRPRDCSCSQEDARAPNRTPAGQTEQPRAKEYARGPNRVPARPVGRARATHHAHWMCPSDKSGNGPAAC